MFDLLLVPAFAAGAFACWVCGQIAIRRAGFDFLNQQTAQDLRAQVKPWRLDGILDKTSMAEVVGPLLNLNSALERADKDDTERRYNEWTAGWGHRRYSRADIKAMHRSKSAQEAVRHHSPIEPDSDDIPFRAIHPRDERGRFMKAVPWDDGRPFYWSKAGGGSNVKPVDRMDEVTEATLAALRGDYKCRVEFVD